MNENVVQLTTFPLRLQPTFSEVVSKAAKLTPLSKHDWCVQAIKEKLERDQQAV
jgi:predicted HicB family RNase H-like nuclease